MHARVLKFHVWIPHGKIADLYFFLVCVTPFLELCPFEKIRIESCQQVLSIKVLEVLRGMQLAHNSFYFTILLQRSQPLKFDFISNEGMGVSFVLFDVSLQNKILHCK